MSAKKKTISRVLSLVLIVALIVPALLVVPVSAESDLRLYNGVELPVLPDRSLLVSSVYPDRVFSYPIILTNDNIIYKVYFCSSPWIYYNGFVTCTENFSIYRFDCDTSTLPLSWAANGSYNYKAYTTLSLPIWSESNIYNESGTLFIEGSSPVDPNAPTEVPDFDVLQSWLDTDTYTFVENSTATSFNVAVSGGSVTPTYSYQWYYGSSQGGEFTAIPNETQASFTPKTSAEYIGTSLYFCRITAVLDGVTKSADSGYLQVTVTEEPPPTTDPPATEPSEPDTPDVPDETTPDYSEKLEDIQGSLDDVNNSIGEVGDKVDELPDKITDGMADIMEQEKEQATQQGGQFVDDITGVVPNDSQGFIDALGSLVSVLSYDGTECVLPIPALTLPAIGGLFPSYTVMEAQEVDFEEFFAMMPPSILLLVQSLLTVALIVYCFKELYDTVAYFFVLKGGNK